MPRQDELFSTSEGDAWFERNKEWLDEADPAEDNVIRLLDRAGVKPKAVLEIGAANGFRVAAMVRHYGCKGVASDPSEAAVADGNSRFPNIEIVRAPAHDLSMNGPFDLVVVHFVLHWVDRAMLTRTIAEIDRLVADDGLLLIGDFLPYKPVRVPYHHLPGENVFTFKQDYAAPFLASGLYQLVTLDSGSYEQLPGADVSERDRMALWLLKKSLSGFYAQH